MTSATNEQQHYGTVLRRRRTEGGRLIPVPNEVTAPFWASCRERRMRLQRCDACSSFRYYPTPICPHCWSRRHSWVEVGGRGTIYSFTWVHRPAPGFRDQVPYAYALVQLDEGPVMPTNIVGADPGTIAVGDAVTVDYLELAPKVLLPVFRTARAEEGD
jgi:uncharacterized OB-fold protein